MCFDARTLTATLVSFAKDAGYTVPTEWVIQDDGYSGANLVRPDLELLRDLVAEGQIQAVVVWSPDRLSRKYAYQVLLLEEFARHGVEVVFVNAPQSDRPEDQLLLQFQGMIAEYERAQIVERSRRGKRYRAKAGEISVLSGAPYGYRYVRKNDGHAAYYEVIEAEARVVRRVYDLYTRDALSIGAITWRLKPPLCLCAISHFDAHQRTQDPLLPLPGFGCLALWRQSQVRLPPHPARSAGPYRMVGDRSLAGGSKAAALPCVTASSNVTGC